MAARERRETPALTRHRVEQCVQILACRIDKHWRTAATGGQAALRIAPVGAFDRREPAMNSNSLPTDRSPKPSARGRPMTMPR
jgi:hypothetical protein